MNLSQTKFTQEMALAMITAAAPGHVTVPEMMAYAGCSDGVCWKKLRRLMERGLVDYTVGPNKVRQYVLGDGRKKLLSKPAVAKAVKAAAVVGNIVPPFKTNNWTPQLSGYERSMRARADLAMAGRA